MKLSTRAVVFTAISTLSSLLAQLPENLALGVGRFFGLLCFYLSARRRYAYADLKAAFGTRFNEKERWAIVRNHYRHMGQTVIEIIRFPSMDLSYVERKVRIYHRERFYEAIDQNKGVVLLTAHFGNWELLQIISGILGKPIYVLARNQKQVEINEMLNQLRESHGSRAVSRGMGVRDLYRALIQKQLIGLLGDQDAGKRGGLILSFFGRKTTVPTGAFEMARRTGAPILPCFDIRREKGQHEIVVGMPIHCGEGAYGDDDLVGPMQEYLKRLEEMIEASPEQWLWGAKRWKYTWTKRILILSDGKPGHVKQSEALAAHMTSLKDQYGRPGMEYPVQRLEVQFKSGWRRQIFPWVAFIMMPWIQGRCKWLRFFFESSTAQALEEASADFILSAGSALIPLNLLLARENRAKSVVLMKPSFPFNFFKYDLAVIPVHDRGWMPKETFRTLIALNPANGENLKLAGLDLLPELHNPGKVKISLFIGGDTRAYRMDIADIEKVISSLEKIAPQAGDYLVTTSRRTPEGICRFLKAKQSVLKACQMLVIASEDARPQVANGMLSLTEIVLVTEDSISMISEAVAAGKKVIVLAFNQPALPSKHRRFTEHLAEKGAVVVCTTAELEKRIRDIHAYVAWDRIAETEAVSLKKKLEAIL